MYVGSNEWTTLGFFFACPPSLGFPPAARRVGGGSFSLCICSSKNLTMASTSGVAPPPVFEPPAPHWPFKSPSCLSRFHNGGECTSSCNTASAKHILPVFTSPRARRSGGAVFSCGRGDILPLRRARDSAFGKGGEVVRRSQRRTKRAENWGRRLRLRRTTSMTQVVQIQALAPV